ncbi:uncharacterized protein LOC119274616 [Triticum dicoccoides]|uniref:uncharacterized protein LOC119274616 n=1 Tax=Triticum dicoccoides TaxID=85692 RepID=UPI00162AFA05|nr:uncharacterized protein LOC119274616 [Triticum dicoccoides]
MRAALRLASALRRLPARTGDLVSSQAVLPPLAGRAPLLSRALSLPHLPAAVRRFSDKSPKDHLDRATTLIKQGELLVEEGKVISRHLTKGVKDSTKDRLRVFKSGLSDIIRTQFRHHWVNRVAWLRISVHSLLILLTGGILIHFGGSYLLDICKPHMKAIATKAIDKAEEKGKELARSDKSRAEAQKFIDQALNSFSIRAVVFGWKKKKDEEPSKKEEAEAPKK